jgi:hypothetical protein
MTPFKSLALVIALLSTTGCTRTAEVSYRMTIEVEDNGQIYSGTGVWKQTYQGGRLRGLGDAIAVDIGAKGTLYVMKFARRSGPEGVFYGSMLFGEQGRIIRGQPVRSFGSRKDMKDIASRVGESDFVDCYNMPEFRTCPRMVAFADIGDPKSAVEIDPANLGAFFGSGVQLRPIRVTITEEPVTESDHCARLPWLKQFNDIAFDGGHLGTSAGRGVLGSLSASAFVYGGCH